MTRRARRITSGQILAMLIGSLGLVSKSHAQPAPDSDALGYPRVDGIVLVLLDRTGSMSAPGAGCATETGGHVDDGSISKWSCAINRALYDLVDRDNGKSPRYFLWDFAYEYGSPPPPFWSVDQNGQNLGSADISDALALNKAALQSALNAQRNQTPYGTTPLAGAYCEAIDKLGLYRTADLRESIRLTLRVYSDGLENYTTALSLKCAGVESSTAFVEGNELTVDLTYSGAASEYISTADGLQVPSWQSNVLDRAVTGTTHEPDPNDQNSPKRVLVSSLAFQPGEPVADNNFVTNIAFFDEWVQSPLDNTSILRAIASDQAPTSTRSSTTTLTNSEGLAFLKGLAKITGGRLIVFGGVVTPGDPTAPHVIPGDADNSGCVDLADFELVKRYYGQGISSADPLSYAADINYDGVTNLADYLLLQTQYGQGCASPPAPMPLLQQVLFGFESLASWSSDQAPLTLARLPRTEGDYAMSVGGRGLRIIKTADLDTSIFEGVSSHLALDVAPPTSEANHCPVGEVLLLASCPSAHIYYMPLGMAELSEKPLGTYSTVKFNVPWLLRRVMSKSHSDFSFTIVLRAHDPGFLFDNLRFVP